MTWHLFKIKFIFLLDREKLWYLEFNFLIHNISKVENRIQGLCGLIKEKCRIAIWLCEVGMYLLYLNPSSEVMWPWIWYMWEDVFVPLRKFLKSARFPHNIWSDLLYFSSVIHIISLLSSICTYLAASENTPVPPVITSPSSSATCLTFYCALIISLCSYLCTHLWRERRMLHGALQCQ